MKRKGSRTHACAHSVQRQQQRGSGDGSMLPSAGGSREDTFVLPQAAEYRNAHLQLICSVYFDFIWIATEAIGQKEYKIATTLAPLTVCLHMSRHACNRSQFRI